jgi:hypothetical protein
MRLAASFLLVAVLLHAAPQEYDLVVYGGTAGGAMTAIAGAREGLHVLLLEPGQHIGGMATGGLSRTDFGKKEVIGGYAMEFYWRVGLKYAMGRFAQDVAWYYEPKVGEQVLREMLQEARVETKFGTRLAGQKGVVKSGARIEEIRTEDGATYKARMFSDSTYEGDLMAQAGVEYTWGRESAAQYGESLAGVREHTPLHQFLDQVRARDANGKLLPEISDGPKGEKGSADRKVQSYNFRMIMSDDPANQIPYPKPPGYNPHRYELLALRLAAETQRLGRAPHYHEEVLIAPIPNHKADFNNQGAFSTDYIGGSWKYPNASYSERAAIRQAHVDYTKGILRSVENMGDIRISRLAAYGPIPKHRVVWLRGERRSRRSARDRETRGTRDAPRQAIFLQTGEAFETRSGSLLPVGGAGCAGRHSRSADRS